RSNQSYITMDDGIVDFGADVNFTMSAWVKPDLENSNWGRNTFMAEARFGNDGEWIFAFAGAGDTIWPRFRPYGRNELIVSGTPFEGDENPTKWMFLTTTGFTNSSGTTLKLYEEGVLVDTSFNETPWNMTDPGQAFRIGGLTVGITNWNGMIDKVEIWNDTLSGDDILNVYNDGRKSTTKRNESLMVSQYLFDNSSEVRAIDSIGNNNGTFWKGANYSYEVLKAVGYWNFDGEVENTEGFTAYDWSSNNIDGTGINNAVANSSDCIYGNCLQ
ncbi:unnamed protein product, partial [marine sediment metagenome]